jgi:hypothetical protein
MRDDDSDDTPVVLLRLPPGRELPPLPLRGGLHHRRDHRARERSVLLRRLLRRGAYSCAYAARQSQLTADKQASDTREQLP